MKRAFKLTALAAAGLGTMGIALRVLNGPRRTPETLDGPDDEFEDGVIGGSAADVTGAIEEPVIGGAARKALPSNSDNESVIGEMPARRGRSHRPNVEAATAPVERALGTEGPLTTGEDQPVPVRNDGATVTSHEATRSADAYLDEGNVYFGVGQYTLAIDRYSQAIEAAPDLVAAYYNRANANSRAAHYEDALADYDRALELAPDDSDALNNRGMLHLYREEYAKAEADFDAALAVEPGDTTIVVNRGLARLNLGQPAAALADFEHAARLDPDDGAAEYGAAQASAALARRDDALRHVARAMELDEHYVSEAASDPKLEPLQGDDAFLKLLRESKKRAARRG